MKTMERIRRRRKEQKAKVEDAARLNQALKAVNLNLQASPAAQVASLEIYIERLQALRSELASTYGNVRELVRIDVEISNAISQVANLRISMIQPGEGR